MPEENPDWLFRERSVTTLTAIEEEPNESQKALKKEGWLFADTVIGQLHRWYDSYEGINLSFSSQISFLFTSLPPYTKPPWSHEYFKASQAPKPLHSTFLLHLQSAKLNLFCRRAWKLSRTGWGFKLKMKCHAGRRGDTSSLETQRGQISGLRIIDAQWKENALTMNSTPRGRENQQLYFVFIEYAPFLLLLPCDRLSQLSLLQDSEHRRKKKRSLSWLMHIYLPFLFVIHSYMNNSLSFITKVWHRGLRKDFFFLFEMALHVTVIYQIYKQCVCKRKSLMSSGTN